MQPILYSFRRCPYAIRARMALLLYGVAYETVEVSLKEKPEALLKLNPAGTVPVLVIDENTVIAESLDIIRWAMAQNEKQGPLIAGESQMMQELIQINDTQFKHWLDRYKYADRHPEQTEEDYQFEVQRFLNLYDAHLQTSQFFAGVKPSIADIAIFPFVRQCAAVKPEWFDSLAMPSLQRWLDYWLNNDAFKEVMKKV
ncbi:MAG TPA: glutathione S-transferase [Gammaproteobacteria bacterium]|nr:glutathione S-transferase [Gammaproteobacteria bacterium]MEC8010183.1 glutathione S-transferase [Pseudomonadota bacterium]HBF07519.1 glutathione S-transferase [Gammaproteobacteria bacterium]HCK92117.1 glutathione S-transferase [Gammaproteobacteria bacterium]